MIKLRKLALDVLYALRSAGADSAECTVRSSSIDESNSLGKAVYLLREFDSIDLEFRAIVDGRSAEVHINQLDPDGIRRATQRCIDIARHGLPDKDASIGYKNPIEPEQRVLSRDAGKLYRRFEELTETIKDEYPSISSDAMAQYSEVKILYLNTDGQEVTQRKQWYYCGWQGNASDGIAVTDVNFFSVDTRNLDKPFIEQGMVRSKLEETALMLYPQKIPGGKFVGTIVLRPDSLPAYTSQIVKRVKNMKEGDGLPFPSCSRGISIYSALSDTEYESNMPPKNSPHAVVEYVVRNGDVVPDPTKDMTPAERAAHAEKRQANVKRLSVQVSGTEGGQTPYKELIKGIERGLLIGHIQGTMPNPDGEFSGAAKNSFYIEDGEIKHAVIETMVSGNVFLMFKNVQAVSKETVYENGHLSPWIAVGGITIS